MKRKLLSVLALAAVVGLMSAGASANTTPTMLVYDWGTGTFLYITDNGVNDTNPALGAITFLGGIGNFGLQVNTGLASPPLPTDNADLHFLVTNTTGVDDTLAIVFNTLGWTSQGSMNAQIGGTQNGDLYWGVWQDNTNTGCVAPACPGGVGFNVFQNHLTNSPFSDQVFANVGNGGNPYALEQSVWIHLAGVGSTTSGDFSISVPEPTSLSLLGFGLLALNGLRKKFMA